LRNLVRILIFSCIEKFIFVNSFARENAYYLGM